MRNWMKQFANPWKDALVVLQGYGSEKEQWAEFTWKKKYF